MTMPGRPAAVLAAAALSIAAAAISFVVFALSFTALVFGGMIAAAEIFARELVDYTAAQNLTWGMNFVLTLFAAAGFAVTAFFALLAVGLLKRWKIAWYVQVVTSVLGLAGFPFWTAVNAAILVFFFMRPTRQHFGV